MRKKKTDLIIALKVIDDLIKNKRFHTLADYIILTWSKFPRIRFLDYRNVKVMEYLKKGDKNEKGNVIRFTKRIIN